MTMPPKLTPDLADIYYPESDGEAMPEGDFQREYVSYATKALRIWFQNRPDVYVSGDLFIYYQKGNPKISVAPDTFVAFGVDQGNRGSYKIWQEQNVVPQFVLEITSEATYLKDQRNKVELYSSLGVKEYFQYDPTAKFLKPIPLVGMRLDRGKYLNLAARESNGIISIYSETLNLEVRIYLDRGLRFYDRQSQNILRTHEEEQESRLESDRKALEANRARLNAEAIAQQERIETLEAKAIAQKLSAYLKSIGVDPDSLS